MIRPNNLIVVLAGTSSSGKSSILQYLRHIIDVDVLSLDEFLRSHELFEQLAASWSDTIYCKIYEDFCLHARSKSLVSQTLLLDTVGSQEMEQIMMESTLAQLSAVQVLVYCSLSKTVEHVESRNLLPNELEHRTVTQAFDQYWNLFKLKTIENEPVVERVPSIVIFDNLRKLEQECIASLDPDGTSNFEILNRLFISKFQLNDLPEMKELVPERHYDFILDTTNCTASEAVEKLSKFLLSKCPMDQNG